MAYKFNISNKGKALKLELEAEDLIDRTIGETIKGNEISSDLEGYELEITGTSDKAGFPGKKDVQGPFLKRVLLDYGFGMWKRPKKEGKRPAKSPPGLRMRKTVRGNAISPDTVQINMKVVKEGKKKFEEFLKKEEKTE